MGSSGRVGELQLADPLCVLRHAPFGRKLRMRWKGNLHLEKVMPRTTRPHPELARVSAPVEGRKSSPAACPRSITADATEGDVSRDGPRRRSGAAAAGGGAPPY